MDLGALAGTAVAVGLVEELLVLALQVLLEVSICRRSTPRSHANVSAVYRRDTSPCAR